MASPAVYIGALGVGPVCARRAGLIELSRKRSGLVLPAVRIPNRPRPAVPQTLSLFGEGE